MAAAVKAIRPVAQNWLSPAQVAEIVPGMTERRLEYLRGEGRGPAFHKPTPKTVVYAEADVHAWVASTKQETRESR